MNDASTRIHATADVSPKASIGAGTVIWNNAQVREDAVVGRNCSIGKDAYIDIGAIIGDGVKIQNGVAVYAGITVEDNVFLGPYMTFTNDLFPRAFSTDWQIVPTLVKSGASIGANATVICGTTIGEYAMVGAGSVVTRDVPAHALVVGNPARVVGYVCRCGHRIAQPENDEPANRLQGTLSCSTCGENVSV